MLALGVTHAVFIIVAALIISTIVLSYLLLITFAENWAMVYPVRQEWHRETDLCDSNLKVVHQAIHSLHNSAVVMAMLKPFYLPFSLCIFSHFTLHLFDSAMFFSGYFIKILFFIIINNYAIKMIPFTNIMSLFFSFQTREAGRDAGGRGRRQYACGRRCQCLHQG